MNTCSAIGGDYSEQLSEYQLLRKHRTLLLRLATVVCLFVCLFALTDADLRHVYLSALSAPSARRVSTAN